MADLNDTGAWPAGIYQLEQTDPVLGGAPNEATGAGMSNIPHQQLARRTRVLKDVIDASGLGATAVPLVTLNSAQARVTGSYRFAAGDANTPAVGVAGTVQVIAASAAAVNQVAMASGSTRTWVRFWNGTVWSGWSEVWQMPGTSASFGVTGWSRQPNAELVQWGTVTGDALGQAVVTFPTAFADANYNILGMHAGTGGAMVIEDMTFTRTATQARLRCFYHDGGVTPGWIMHWRAIGK